MMLSRMSPTDNCFRTRTCTRSTLSSSSELQVLFAIPRTCTITLVRQVSKRCYDQAEISTPTPVLGKPGFCLRSIETMLWRDSLQVFRGV